MSSGELPGFELLFQPHAGSRMVQFGAAPTLDDVPTRVTETDGTVWNLVFHDEIDRIAIYNRVGEGTP